MKKILLSVSLLISSITLSQDCSNLFISEYVEGWSNNKAIEIYNPTSSAINLSDYFIARYSNGSATAAVKNAVQLTGTIPAYSAYVGVLDKRNPAGTGQEAPVWDSLQARADGFYAPVYAVSESFYWNGNDAIVLAKGKLTSNANDNVTTATGFKIIDIFGKIGEDPGTTGWTTTAPYNNGMGKTVTVDHSLIRKSTIKKGVTTQVASFNALAEYDSIPATTYLIANGDTVRTQAGNAKIFGNWFSLGTHNCGCKPAAIEEIEIMNVAIYPNPSLDGNIAFVSNVGITHIQVINTLGQSIYNESLPQVQTGSLHLTANKGVYVVILQDINGDKQTKRLVIK